MENGYESRHASSDQIYQPMTDGTLEDELLTAPLPTEDFIHPLAEQAASAAVHRHVGGHAASSLATAAQAAAHQQRHQVVQQPVYAAAPAPVSKPSRPKKKKAAAPPSPPPRPTSPDRLVETGQEHTGRWTKEEHDDFLVGLKIHGKEWKKVAARVKTRTVVQTRTHAQKYFQKLQKVMEVRTCIVFASWLLDAAMAFPRCDIKS